MTRICVESEVWYEWLQLSRRFPHLGVVFGSGMRLSWTKNPGPTKQRRVRAVLLTSWLEDTGEIVQARCDWLIGKKVTKP